MTKIYIFIKIRSKTFKNKKFNKDLAKVKRSEIMSLRILSGSLKGKKFYAPKTTLTRPITALLKKSILESCQSNIPNSLVLDLFAGSGALGIESLSRGARFVYFIDKNLPAVQCIKKNLKKLNLQSQAYTLKRSALHFLIRYKETPFDILFIDPPYTMRISEYHNLITTLHTSRVFHTTSSIFLETPTQKAQLFQKTIEALFSIQKTKKTATTSLFLLTVKKQ